MAVIDYENSDVFENKLIFIIKNAFLAKVNSDIVYLFQKLLTTTMTN